MNTSKRVVILGGGFGGVYTAKYLQRWLPKDWKIVLLSQQNHTVFTPLLGDVVGSSINPMHVVWPMRQMLRRVECRTAVATSIDLQRREVQYQTSTGQPLIQPYEHLVLACGSVVNLDILPGMAAHGWPLKTVGDALALRNHVIGMLEEAEVETDPARKRRLLGFAVVGGGFSGVEVTGEVFDLVMSSRRFYPHVRADRIRVFLLEGRDRILPELPQSLSSFALEKMSRRGIDVRVNTSVRAVTEQGVTLQNGEVIEAGTVVCTVGTSVNPLIKYAELPWTANRIKTTPDLRVEGYEQVWTLGDCAAVPNAYDQGVCPPTAQFAVRQAKHLARNLASAIQGRPATPFYFKPLGVFASIGNHKAVGLVFGLRFSGLLAWLLWRSVYLSKMPTVARRIQVAFDWIWQLFFPRDIVQLNAEQTERFGRAHFEPGQFVFRKNDPGEKFYVIENGQAGVYLEEDEPPVAVLGPGDHFGEAALLRSAPRSATVKAEGPLDVLTVSRPAFCQLTGHLNVLRTSLERSFQRRWSSQRFLQAAKDQPQLTSKCVRDVMSRPVTTFPEELSLADALDRSRVERRGIYPVVDNAGRMVGVCTRTDFYDALQDLRLPQIPLSEVLHAPVITVRESDSLMTALWTFLRDPVKRIVVVSDEDGTKPVGILTPFDILTGATEFASISLGAAQSSSQPQDS